jgi:hypothetical protein
MGGIERFLVLSALCYMVMYAPVFVYGALFHDHRLMDTLLPFHFTGMALNFVALVLTIRDVYLRTFPNPNSKITWTLLILYTAGIGWLVYIFRHALKPRVPPTI